MTKDKKLSLTRRYNTRKPYNIIYIFTEGEKTEVNYFNDKKEEIAEIIRRQNIKIEVKGKGRNTESLVDYALSYIKENRLDSSYEYWLVFDRDSFDKTFNSAILRAKKNGLHVAYSNVSFELWYLLHFSYLNTAIGNKEYNEKLNKAFKKLTGNKTFIYDKSTKGVYNLIKGEETVAIKRAKKLAREHEREKSYLKKNPCTAVYLLVERLDKFKNEI